MTLYIAAMSGSRSLEGCPFDQALTQVSMRLAKHRGSHAAAGSAKLDIAFLLPGEQEKPAFSSMRIRAFSAEDNNVHIETAVPEHMMHSSHARRYVIAVIQDAIDNASAFFTECTIGFTSAELMALAESLA